MSTAVDARPAIPLVAEMLPPSEVRAGMLAGPGAEVPGGSRLAVGTPLTPGAVTAFRYRPADPVPVLRGAGATPEQAGSPLAVARATLLQSVFRQSLYATPEARAIRRENGEAAGQSVLLAFATASWLPAVAELIVAKGFRHRFLTQAAESASMAAVCGAALGWEGHRLDQVALAALVCDVGMLDIDRRLLAKPGRLMPHERRQIERHVEIGARALSPLRKVMPLVLRIVEEHQERFDGGGYPLGLRGSSIADESQVVALTRRYLAAVVPSHDRPALAPHLAVDIVFAESEGLASPRVIDAFAKSIAPLPRGEVVSLTDGRMGVVKDYTDTALRPVIEVLWDREGEPVTPYELDLRRERTTFAYPSHLV